MVVAAHELNAPDSGVPRIEPVCKIQTPNLAGLSKQFESMNCGPPVEHSKSPLL